MKKSSIYLILLLIFLVGSTGCIKVNERLVGSDDVNQTLVFNDTSETIDNNECEYSTIVARDFILKSGSGDVRICCGFNTTTLNMEHIWIKSISTGKILRGGNISSTYRTWFCFNSIEEMEVKFSNVKGLIDPRWNVTCDRYEKSLRVEECLA